MSNNKIQSETKSIQMVPSESIAQCFKLRKDRRFVSESDYDSDYYDDDVDHEDYQLESRAETIGLPRKGYGLKHGRVLMNRGSNQKKFNSLRPKTLVKYGKREVPASCNFDSETQTNINNTVAKYHYISNVNRAVCAGERSVLLHCYGHQPPESKKKPEFLLKVYNPQFGMQRIEKWTLNEYSSAWLMFKHINVPNVQFPMKNIIAMNFIGDYGKPAPSLHELTCEITDKMYIDVITSMYKIYNNAKRVHGNLSTRNILWWKGQIYFVSLSRSVEKTHPNAEKLLMRDCCNVTHFFRTKGLLKVKSILNLFKFITGGQQPNPNVLLTLKHNQRHVKNKQKKKKLPTTL